MPADPRAPRGVLHLVGEPAGGVQSCPRCGAELIDNRRAEVAPGETPPRFFQPGCFLYVDAGFSSLWATDDGTVPPCKPAN